MNWGLQYRSLDTKDLLVLFMQSGYKNYESFELIFHKFVEIKLHLYVYMQIKFKTNKIHARTKKISHKISNQITWKKPSSVEVKIQETNPNNPPPNKTEISMTKFMSKN